VSLIQFLRIFWARRAIVLAALLGCVVLATVVTQFLPSRYEARSRVLLDVIKPDPVTGQLMSTQILRAYISTQIELIKDYQTAGRVVDQLGWANDPAKVAEYNKATDGAGTDIRRWLAQGIIEGTEANLLQGSNILEITFTHSSPEMASKIADLIRGTYIDQSLEARQESAGRTADWYREQSEKALRLLTAAEKQRTDFAQANGIVLQADNTDLESSKLAALSTQSVVAGNMPSLGVGAMSSPASIQLDTVEQQLAQAATTLGPNHPVFQSLQRQRQVLAAEVSRQSAAMQKGLAPSGASGAQVESAYQRQKARVIGQQDKIDQINQMQRDIDLKRDQYLKATQRAADLRLEADVGETGLTPLGTATTPTEPSFPNVPLIIVGSIALGLGMGLVAAFLVELVGRRVRSDDDLERAAEAPVFAIVGDSRNPDGWVRKIGRLIDRKGTARRRTLAEAGA
jgi:succinoglycan biosynthesis transport protein ExoP